MFIKKMGVGYDNGVYALNSFKTIIKGTATALRISSVNGTAFLDNCPADILAAVGAQVKIYDASNRFLLGYVGAVGSSETLVEKVTNGDMELDSNWINYVTPTTNERSNVQAHGGTYSRHCIGDGDGDGIQQILSIAGMLLKRTAWAYVVSGVVRESSNSGYISGRNISITGSWQQFPENYLTAKGDDNLIYKCSGGAGEFYIDDVSLRQVTTPSSSGVTILDAIGGNQNFVSKDASFTYNAASYLYEIDTRQRIII